jgi:hypothetical protein
MFQLAPVTISKHKCQLYGGCGTDKTRVFLYIVKIGVISALMCVLILLVNRQTIFGQKLLMAMKYFFQYDSESKEQSFH